MDWNPDLTQFKGPRYLAIAGAIAEDIGRGRLQPGEQMPTHRELAERCGVTVSTVTRAYAEAARLGLIVGETGRGTFVRGSAFGSDSAVVGEAQSVLDLSINVPPVAVGNALASELARLAKCSNLPAILNYQPAAGTERHREIAAGWLSRSGMSVRPQQVVLCSGAIHAITVVLSTLTAPGDTVFTEELTYPGIKNLANFLRLRLQGIKMDEKGIRPDAFEEACRRGAAKFLYCVPTIHNPLGMVMPEERRREIAEIARSHRVSIIEDDVHSFLLPKPPLPLAAFAPEDSYYIVSTSKILAGGLRTGFLYAPERMVQRLTTSIRATIWMAVPLMAEIVTDWIQDGTAVRLIAQNKEEAEVRQKIAGRVLDGLTVEAHPLSYYIWLHLPEPWRSDEFVEQSRRRGIVVSPPEAFVPGRGDVPHAVRICLGAARSREHLEGALRSIKELLAAPPAPGLAII